MDFIYALKQWVLPKEIRLKTVPIDDVMEKMVTEILAIAESQSQKRSSAEPKEIENMISLCNNYYRIYRNIQELEDTLSDSVELRNMKRAIKAFERVLKDMKLRCLDLTGEPFHPGRADFQPIGYEEMPDIDRDTIILCEKPAIFFDENVIQAAKGIIGKPKIV